jgi:hypothetical protein
LGAALILAFSAVGFAQQIVYFPQVVNGLDGNGLAHWHTNIFITNQDGALANGEIDLFNSDGTPMQAFFTDENGNAAAVSGVILFNLGPGQSHKYESTAANPLQVGYGVMKSNVAMAANLTFQHFSNEGPEFLIAEAGVPASTPMGKQSVFADTQFGFNAGVAIVNPTNAAQVITFQLIDPTGVVVATTTQALGPNMHISLFVTDLFPHAPEMFGRLQFFGPGPLVSVALRFDPTLRLFSTLFPFATP